MALIVELLKHAQTHVINRKVGITNSKDEGKIGQKEAEDDKDVTAEMNIDIDISLKNDEKLQSILEVIG